MMGNRHKTGVVAGVLLPMGLVCLFAFCSLALALMGSRAYKQIQGIIDDSFGSTVAANYIRTKLRQNNDKGGITLRQEQGYELLVIESRTEADIFEIRIFWDNGELRESFVQADTAFDPALGVAIAKVRSCKFSISPDGLFEANIESPQGAHTRTAFALLEGVDAS